MADEPVIAAIRVCVGLCRDERALVAWWDGAKPALTPLSETIRAAAWTEVRRRIAELRGDHI